MQRRDIVDIITELHDDINLDEYRYKWDDIIDEMAENRIKNVFLNSINGIPIMNYITSEDDDAVTGHDKDLVGALLTAMKSFVNTLEGEEIEMIETTSYRWITLPSTGNEIIFVAVTDDKVEKFDCVRMLSTIRDEVVEKYRKNFMGDSITKVSQDIRDDIAQITSHAIRSFKIDRIKKLCQE
jgi:predicted regulator of Ras-like GTPase activity (Roadblock/LC7/MglB family)